VESFAVEYFKTPFAAGATVGTGATVAGLLLELLSAFLILVLQLSLLVGSGTNYVDSRD
jgi:hypothetical protein